MPRDWSDAYCLGIAEIDHQHQGFFNAAQRLADQILNCAGEHGVEDAVAFLRDYAAGHFASEEALMRRHGFPGLDRTPTAPCGLLRAAGPAGLRPRDLRTQSAPGRACTEGRPGLAHRPHRLRRPPIRALRQARSMTRADACRNRGPDPGPGWHGAPTALGLLRWPNRSSRIQPTSVSATKAKGAWLDLPPAPTTPE